MTSSHPRRISIHALLAESDVDEIPYQRQIDQFLSTLSLRRATLVSMLNSPHSKFLSTLSLRRATVKFSVSGSVISISIHALLAESDRSANCSCHSARPISIHALLAESDKTSIAGRITSNDFYPRSPCGERHPPRFTPTASRNFYPRSPCGERLFLLRKITITVDISIHALLAESDKTRR